MHCLVCQNRCQLKSSSISSRWGNRTIRAYRRTLGLVVGVQRTRASNELVLVVAGVVAEPVLQTRRLLAATGARTRAHNLLRVLKAIYAETYCRLRQRGGKCQDEDDCFAGHRPPSNSRVAEGNGRATRELVVSRLMINPESEDMCLKPEEGECFLCRLGSF